MDSAVILEAGLRCMGLPGAKKISKLLFTCLKAMSDTLLSTNPIVDSFASTCTMGVLRNVKFQLSRLLHSPELNCSAEDLQVRSGDQ